MQYEKFDRSNIWENKDQIHQRSDRSNFIDIRNHQYQILKYQTCERSDIWEIRVQKDQSS